MTQPDQPLLGSVELLAKERKNGCPICAAYARLRGKRIRDEIQRTIPPADRYATWRRFMAGVHARHLAHTTTSKETR